MSIKANLEDFTIKVANKDQEKQHALAGYDHWQKGEPFEEYRKVSIREKTEAKWGKEAFVTWVLVRKDDTDGEIYSGCETYRRQGFIKRKGATDIEPGFVYCIASVVTPKAHGRNGYATRFLSLLHRHLSPGSTLPPIPASWGKDQPSIPLPAQAAEQIPKAIGSYLWSDVGASFYSKCSIGEGRPGWVVDDAQCSELVWKILPPATVEGSFSWIHLQDLEDVGSLISARLQSNLRQTDTSQNAVFITDPASPGVLDFVPVKGSWKRPTPEPLPVGIRIPSPSGKKEDDAIVLFAVSCIHIGDRFLITHISNLSPYQLPLLLSAIDSLASSSTLCPAEGWAWDLGLSGELVDAWKKQEERAVSVGRREEIDGHLLGVAWYGDDEGRLGNGDIWSWA
ncbi:hypothetical protein L198_05594 [Cryptococcus wingfieldii CBS 7118]|uniref:N-acetyltransferase domain-containing protein n=1 Tax=Cryptococcus wingfieldii CBS 7118 TaxID=1295528 RepID=A0A1E3IW30_9TREE|nr:hypothetical protein L198_05594 [Cryptococcus wingfieldii CBS 7118]ODN92799.1 hypothetical protein L198_05594 [Cryptococcus wingfieldii CBS 7118]